MLHDQINMFVVDENKRKKSRFSCVIEPHVLFEDDCGHPCSLDGGPGVVFLVDALTRISVKTRIERHFDERFLKALLSELIGCLQQEKWLRTASIAELQEEVRSYGQPFETCDIDDVNALNDALLQEMTPKGPHVSVMDENTWGTRVIRHLMKCLNDRNNLQGSTKA